MQVGTLGDLTFEVSSCNVVTPNSLKFSYSSRFEDHEVQGWYEQTEFLAPSLGTVTLGMHLRRDLCGQSPIEVVLGLMEKSREGEIVRLVIGKVSFGRFTIRKVDYDWNYLLKSEPGPFSLDITVELKEYYE